jgi:hypothetical protein
VTGYSSREDNRGDKRENNREDNREDNMRRLAIGVVSLLYKIKYIKKYIYKIKNKKYAVNRILFLATLFLKWYVFFFLKFGLF